MDDGEREVAERFADLLSRVRGAPVGAITEHDARLSDLHVDFTLDEADPPAAVELTSIRDIAHTRTFGSSKRLQETLDELAQSEHLGSFTLTVGKQADLRALEVEAPTLMRRMVEVDRRVFRPGQYGVEDLQVRRTPREQRRFQDEHLRLHDLGLLDIARQPEGEDSVEVMTMSDFDLEGLDRELADVVEANAAKLHEAREALSCETHLVVLVDPHGDPESTQVPFLPESIDFLWLLLKFEFVPGRPYVWWAGKGEPAWTTIEAW